MSNLMSGAKMLLECLARQGVDIIFGYPGGVTLPFYDGLYDHPIKHVLVRHEENAAFAAEGYARSTGKVGVCCATSLVGVTPADGKVLWRAAFPFKVSTAASPVVYEDIVYCSAGYGVGAGAFKISKSGSGLSAEAIWRRENECFNHWSTPVVKDGYL